MCVMFNGFHLRLYIYIFDIQCNGSDIKWKYITDLYLRNTEQVTEIPGLSLVPKIKYEHIHLTSFSKMRVDLAAQVCMVFNARYAWYSMQGMHGIQFIFYIHFQGFQ